MDIKVPFLKNDIKLGDGIEAVTKRLGIPTCGGCGRRKALANQVTFKGSGSETLAAKEPPKSPWATVEYPEIPEGWRLVSSKPAKDTTVTVVNYYESDTGAMYIWQIIDGKYKRGHGFGMPMMKPSAEKVLAELWL